MLDQDQTPGGDVVVDMTPPGPPTPLPPPSPRSLRRLWLSLIAVAVALVTTFFVVFADNLAAFGAYRYSPPQQFLGLPHVPPEKTPKLPAAATANLKFDAYQSEDRTRTVVLTVHQQPSFLPDTAIDGLVSEAVKGMRSEVVDLHEVDPGERGGVMKCGHLQRTGFKETPSFCAWSDGSMWAVYFENINQVSVTTETLADHAREIRRTAEVPS
ncbi:hypothetical protein [Kitasatospora sp. NPDC097643]|uniref:hypothetical protein n=1 Tax=Kitasatospora sp. NPDC097643 TaxID=3157230 RepID=UPI00331D22A9